MTAGDEVVDLLVELTLGLGGVLGPAALVEPLEGGHAGGGGAPAVTALGGLDGGGLDGAAGVDDGGGRGLVALAPGEEFGELARPDGGDHGVVALGAVTQAVAGPVELGVGGEKGCAGLLFLHTADTQDLLEAELVSLHENGEPRVCRCRPVHETGGRAFHAQ